MPFWPFFAVCAVMNFIAVLIASLVADVGDDGHDKFWFSLFASLGLDFVVVVSWLVAKGLLA